MTPAELSAAVLSVVHDAVTAGELNIDPSAIPADATIERPKSRDHGDYATTLALRLAKPAGRPPREVAEVLAARLRRVDSIASVDIAGPGFLNIRLEQAAAGELVRTILAAGPDYGRSTSLDGQRINLEFVSANPTGPIHIGGVRWAAVGDALARVLAAAGATVTREYYLNDAGAQIDRFAASLLAAAHGEQTPEDGYAGAYIAETAAEVVAAQPGLLDRERDEQLAVFRASGLELMVDQIKRSLADFGVDFDVWSHESALHASGEVTAAVARLREQGHVFEKDDACWLRTTDFGDDKDRVLIRKDGQPTYFAADAAYYLDKRDRGHDTAVYMLGADHHGYVQRLKAIAACAGDDPERNIEVLIGQLVKMVKDGEEVRLSKRAGNIVTLDDVVEAVGVDAARYTLARSSTDSMITLDIGLLTSQSNENPVFYVQYVAARTFRVGHNASELGVDRGDLDAFQPGLLTHEKESVLLGSLAEFPAVVAGAAALREPHRVARHLEKIAGDYHRFYDSCRMLPRGDEEFTDTMRARLWLNDAVRQVVVNGLGLLGVVAPERM